MRGNPSKLKPAQKGEVRNPKGRPKGSPNRATVLRKWLSVAAKVANPETGKETRGTIEDRVALGLITRAMNGDPAAFRELMDSVYGKQTGKLDLTSAGKQITGFQLVDFDGSPLPNV